MVGGDTFSGFSGDALTVGSSGTAGNPITITVSGAGTVTIDMTGVAPASHGIGFGGHQYVTIDGVRGNAVAGDTNYGLRIINIPVDGWCTYENGGGANLRMLHVECTGSAVTSTDDNRGGPFWTTFGGDGNELAFNWIHGPNVVQINKWHALCMRIFTPGFSGNTSFTSNLIHDNRCDFLYHDGIGTNNNVSVYNNEISHVDGSGHADSIEIQGFQYVAVYNNYVHDSGDQNIYFDCIAPSQVCHHVRVYNNIIHSDPGFGVVIDAEGAGSLIDDVVLANNTIVGTSASQTSGGRGTITNAVIKNNIYGRVSVGGDVNVELGAGFSFVDANAWDYDVYASNSINFPVLAFWTSGNLALAQMQALSREVHGKTGNPTFVNFAGNDFHLASSDTVARGAGVNLTTVYPWLTADKDGNPRPSSGAWDMGAYQSVVGTRPNPPTSLTETVQ